MQHVPRERGYFQQVSWDHILEGSTFPNKYNLKNRKRTPIIPDFKLSPCLECCMLSFGWFPGVWILYADVSEHSVPSSQAGRCV